MCGRFTLLTDWEQLIARFHINNHTDDVTDEPRYNIAPSQSILAVIHDGKKARAGRLRWGLIPAFAKNPQIGYKMINARAETIDEKPAYKRLLSRKRCLLPADSFYEWRRDCSGKTPMRILRKDQQPFAFAGLWDRWQSPDGQHIHTCTIITTSSNQLMQPIHGRMPVILTKAHENMWLDRSITDPALLKSFLVPYDTEEMTAYPVSDIVNSPKNDNEACIQKV